MVVVDDLTTSEGRSVNPEATLIEGSVTDLELLTSAMRGADCVFPHCGVGTGAEVHRRPCRDTRGQRERHAERAAGGAGEWRQPRSLLVVVERSTATRTHT